MFIVCLQAMHWCCWGQGDYWYGSRCRFEV